MKHLIIFCLFTFAFCFLYSCGDDNTINNPPVTPPPTLQDSIVKLFSPSNGQHFNTGDSVSFIWSRGYYSAFFFYTGLDSDFSTNNHVLVIDTNLSGVWIDTSQSVNYWKIVPYFNDTVRYEYSSEVRSYFTN